MTSTPQLGENARRAAATYSAAADHYTAPTVGFWDRFGIETVRRLTLPPGGAVLDVCCGAGASALPAARAVGSGGRVLGVDVAEPLLQIARRRAAAEGLHQAEFRCADATGTGLPDATFDAVVCQQGAQFFPDLTAALKETARVTRPEGRFAATVWSPAALTSPYFAAQHEVIEEYGGPDPAASFAAAFACTPDHLTTALHTAGFHDPKTHELTFGISLPPLAEFAPGHLSVLPWAQQILDTEGAEALTAAGQALTARLAAHATTTFAFTATLATATR
jgi:ubiquinone/menaquinone biosynthesis C-methylase UbiE